MPLLGPLFYGPNPGPCSMLLSSIDMSQPLIDERTYHYDNLSGKLLSYETTQTPTTNVLNWSGDTLVSMTTTDETTGGVSQTDFEWGTNYVISRSPSSEARYELTDNGYPTTSVVTYPADGTVRLTNTFEYEGCRLVFWRAVDPSGKPDAGGQRAVTFDAQGRVSTRRYDLYNFLETYYYGCWN